MTAAVPRPSKPDRCPICNQPYSYRYSAGPHQQWRIAGYRHNFRGWTYVHELDPEQAQPSDGRLYYE